MRLPTRIRSAILFAVSSAIICVTSSCTNQSDIAAVINVDPSTTYQTMTGWEVTARVWEYDKKNNRFDGSWNLYRDDIFKILVEDVGINRLRIEVRSGSENPVDYWRKFESGEISYKEMKSHFYEKINDNRDPKSANPEGFHFSHLDYQVEEMLLPLKEMLEARGEKLYVNLCFVDFKWTKLKGDFELALQPEEYAELITEAYKHLEDKYGLTPDALEIILEPDNSDRWRGREIGQAIVAVDRRLDDHGYHPEFIAPSTASASRATDYFNQLIRVPGAKERVSVLAYHRYDGAKADAALGDILSAANKAGVRTEMLEYTNGTGRNMFDDIAQANASAWQLYMMARKHNAQAQSKAVLVDVDLNDLENPKVKLSQRGRYIAQLGRDIRLGAQRIGASTSDDNVEPLAFRNPDGSYVVVLRAARAGRIEITGLPDGRYNASFTSRDHSARELAEVIVADHGSGSVDMPTKGLMTLVSGD